MRKLLLIPIIAFLASCSRDAANTNRQMNISGSVYDSSNKKAMPSVKVRMYWVNESFREIPVDSVYSDAQGKFSFSAEINLARFESQTLIVEAVVPGKYLSVHDMDHPAVGAAFKGFGDRSTWQLQPFAMYEKADLTINLQRNANDNFSELVLSYNHGNRDYWVNLTNTRPTGNMTYQVITAASVKTKVGWKKKFSAGTTASFLDSINVLANTANSITVGY